MSNPIDIRLQQRQQAKEEDQAAEQKEREQNAEKLFAEMKEYIGADVWAIFEKALAGKKVQWKKDGRDVLLIAEIPAIDEYQLAPIEINFSHTSTIQSYYGPFYVHGQRYKTIDETLAEARDFYPKYKAAILDQQIKTYLHDLTYSYWSEHRDDDKAVAAFANLNAIAPERAAEWQKALDEYFTRRDNNIREIEENRRGQLKERVERERQEEINAATIALLKTHYLSYWQTLEENKKYAADIQSAFDTEFQVYLLTYGVIAGDEEGENYIETHSVYVRGDADLAGYFETASGPKKYFHPVSLGLETVKPSQDILSKKVRRHGVTLYFAPTVTDLRIESLLEGLEPLPAKPETDPQADQYFCNQRAEREARKEIGEFSGDDLDY